MSDTGDLSKVVLRTEINRLAALIDDMRAKNGRLLEQLNESEHREASLRDHVDRLSRYQGSGDKHAIAQNAALAALNVKVKSVEAERDAARDLVQRLEERLSKPIQAFQLEELLLWDKIKNLKNAHQRSLVELRDVAHVLQRRSVLLADCLGCDQERGGYD